MRLKARIDALEQRSPVAPYKAFLWERGEPLADALAKAGLSLGDDCLLAFRGGGPCEVDCREVINAARYLMRSGCGRGILPSSRRAGQQTFGTKTGASLFMKTVICFPDSPGCEASGRIVASAIGPVLHERKGTLEGFRVPYNVTREQLVDNPRANSEVDCVFFMEQVFDHPALMNARHRILIPNPEWLGSECQSLAMNCTHVWHKSRYSLERLTPVFPQAQHAYLGFTSQDPGKMVTDYETFVHLRGKAFTQRNTDSIFAAWKSTRSWPDLYVHFYLAGIGGVQYPGWLHDGNVHVRMGWLDRPEYLELASIHGIHLCTSEVEGFGHYINEARAMGALVITTDGAPMNELVDDESGILVRRPLRPF